MKQSSTEKEHITLCLFDVLGTSEMTKRNELNKIYSCYSKLSEIVNQYDDNVFGTKLFGARVPIPQPDGTSRVARGTVYIHHAFFSDTFIFWIKTHPLDVWIFNKVCNELFCKTLELQIPIRGCLSSGEAIMDIENRMFIGQPLVEAARGETGQQWLGLTHGSSFDDKLHWDLEYYIPYKKHIKDGYSEILSPFAIDWARHWRSTRSEDAITLIKSMNKEEKFSNYYDTTIDFYLHSQRHSSNWYNETKALCPSTYDEYLRDTYQWLDTLALEVTP